MSLTNFFDDMAWWAGDSVELEVEALAAEAKRAISKSMTEATWRLNETEACLQAVALAHFTQTVYRYGARRNASTRFDTSVYFKQLAPEHRGDEKGKGWGFDSWLINYDFTSDKLWRLERRHWFQGQYLKYITSWKARLLFFV